MALWNAKRQNYYRINDRKKRQNDRIIASLLLTLKTIFQPKADFAIDFIIDLRIDSVIDFIIDSVIEFVINSEFDCLYTTTTCSPMNPQLEKAQKFDHHCPMRRMQLLAGGMAITVASAVLHQIPKMPPWFLAVFKHECYSCMHVMNTIKTFMIIFFIKKITNSFRTVAHCYNIHLIKHLCMLYCQLLLQFNFWTSVSISSNFCQSPNLPIPPSKQCLIQPTVISAMW